MKEIIVKREDDRDLSLEIIENKYLRVSISECGEGIEFMDFTLKEIDDLQEAISILKDRLQRNLSNKKDIVTHIEQIVEEKSTYGGEIADFPIEVVEKMLDNQVLQGNPRDVSVFEFNSKADNYDRGFNWFNTCEGYDFWKDVILNKNFPLFFERYPKKDSFLLT